MSSDQPLARGAEKTLARGFYQLFAQMRHPTPTTINGLLSVINAAENADVIDAEVRLMLERAIRMSSMSAADIMLPSSRVDMLDINAPYDENLQEVLRTAHSRFPVYEESRENIIGILLTKDLLKLQRSPNLNLRSLLRPALSLPETKRLHDLLRDFRQHRNHMAMLIDEFGRTSGMVTIEDVIEEIVGEIEDEFDQPEEEGEIYALADASWRISGGTPIERVEESFDVLLRDKEELDEIQTIGGLIAHKLGHVPRRGETLILHGLHFKVLHTKGASVRWFRMQIDNS